MPPRVAISPDNAPAYSMKKIRLLVVDDNRLLRDGIVAMARKEPDLKVVKAIGDTAETVQKIRELKPHVVLLDLGLRNQNSLQIVKSVKKNSPEPKMIVMDLVPTQSDIFEFVKAGASGFLLKDATIGDFLKTIRSVARGKKVLPSGLTGSLFSQIVEQAVSGSKGNAAKLMESVRMTRRERQVIELIADGMTNKEIALRLHLSSYTVKSHVHNILEKLALRTRVQIANYAHTTESFQALASTVSLMEE